VPLASSTAGSVSGPGAVIRCPPTSARTSCATAAARRSWSRAKPAAMFSLCLILVPERGGCSIGQRLGDSPLQRLADREQAAGGNPVNPRLVLMRLLIGHADRVGELLLREREHDPPLADAPAMARSTRLWDLVVRVDWRAAICVLRTLVDG
jgi:hypothetical protein